MPRRITKQQTYNEAGEGAWGVHVPLAAAANADIEYVSQHCQDGGRCPGFKQPTKLHFTRMISAAGIIITFMYANAKRYAKGGGGGGVVRRSQWRNQVLYKGLHTYDWFTDKINYT